MEAKKQLICTTVGSERNDHLGIRAEVVSSKSSKNAKKVIVAKALDGQRYLLPLCEYIWMYNGRRGSGPERANDLCLVSFEALDWY